MDAETIKKLRELAEAATAPRWQSFHDNEGAENREYYIGPLGDGFLDRAIAVDLSEANAAFIAAANPAAILSLLDALDTQSSRTEAMRKALEAAADQLERVHDDAFTQAAGYGLLTSDGRDFSCFQLNVCSEAASAARKALSIPVEAAHSDDLAVDRFAKDMKIKLAKKRAEGFGGWDDPEQCHIDYLVQLLAEQIHERAVLDPIDIANLSMMIHQRGETPSHGR